jgi:hypothetical protein
MVVPTGFFSTTGTGTALITAGTGAGIRTGLAAGATGVAATGLAFGASGVTATGLAFGASGVFFLAAGLAATDFVAGAGDGVGFVVIFFIAVIDFVSGWLRPYSSPNVANRGPMRQWCFEYDIQS